MCNVFRDDKHITCHETRYMPRQRTGEQISIVARRMRERREALTLAQEKVGVAIGLDESSARARISRYELGVHEPPLDTTRLRACVLQVPLPYLYCEDEETAALLLALHALPTRRRRETVRAVLAGLRADMPQANPALPTASPPKD